MSESAGPVICAGDLESELLGKQSVASCSRGEEVPSSGIIFRFNLSTKIDKLRQIWAYVTLVDSVFLVYDWYQSICVVLA